MGNGEGSETALNLEIEQSGQTLVPGAPPANPDPPPPVKKKGGRPKGSVPWNKGLKKGQMRRETPEAAAARVETAAPNPNKQAMEHSQQPPGQGGAQAPPTGGPTPGPLAGVPTPEESANAERRSNCYRAGAQTADTVVLMLRSIFGPEWGYMPPRPIPGTDPPIVYDERAELQRAYGETFEYYGWDRFPAWASMPIATMAFAAVRMQMPETQKRVATYKEKLAAWWAARKVRKETEKANRGAEVRPAAPPAQPTPAPSHAQPPAPGAAYDPPTKGGVLKRLGWG